MAREGGIPTVSHGMALAAAIIAGIAIAAPALLYRLGDLPIVNFDESRVANDALEMVRSGFTLAPTYGGVVDHYLLKPPLAVWLEALAMAAFGPTELAVRAASIIAAFGTGAILIGLLGIHLRRPLAAFVAIALLFSSAGYLDFHAARSGDVDGLMTFFTVAWLVAAFLYLEDGAERRRLWLACWVVAITLDVMVKSAAGVIAFPAVILYALWRGRLRETLTTKSVWLALGTVVVVVSTYFALRETVDPGYTSLAIGTDLLDRSASTLEGHVGGPMFYIEHSIAGTIGFLRPTGAFPLLVPSILAAAVLAAVGERRLRPIAGFLAISLAVMLGILSAMTTKIVWYALPLYPLAAAAIGVTVAELKDWLVAAWPRGRGLIDGAVAIACLAVVALIIPTNARSVDQRIAAYAADERYATGLFVDGPVARAGYSGYAIAADPAFGPAVFYARAAARDNRPAPIVSAAMPLPAGTSKVVACGSAIGELSGQGMPMAPLLVDGGCALYAVAPGQTGGTSGASSTP